MPSYVDVVPALQYGSVGMALALARLVEASGGAGFGTGTTAPPSAAELRANASRIADAALTHLWRDDDGGAWRCMYPNGSTAAVRSITDYIYVSQALGFLGRNASFALPPRVVNASLAFFARELLAPGDAWVRALSLADPLCANFGSATPSIEDLLVCRAGARARRGSGCAWDAC